MQQSLRVDCGGDNIMIDMPRLLDISRHVDTLAATTIAMVQACMLLLGACYAILSADTVKLKKAIIIFLTYCKRFET